MAVRIRKRGRLDVLTLMGLKCGRLQTARDDCGRSRKHKGPREYAERAFFRSVLVPVFGVKHDLVAGAEQEQHHQQASKRYP